MPMHSDSSENRVEPPSSRARVRRNPGRARYDDKTTYDILDRALLCHVGFIAASAPHVIPMVVARDQDRLLLHGSPASRLMRELSAGVDVCVSVTHLDGVVVARSAFHNSLNYRSVVVYGKATLVAHEVEKVAALRVLTEHVMPGRWDEARRPSSNELKATSILSVPLDEASAKIRSGPPKEDQQDLQLAVWAGEIPLRTMALVPVPDPSMDDSVEPPPSIWRFLMRWNAPDASPRVE